MVENRAATEGQLRDIAGSITNQQQGGGFALSSDEKGADKIVKQDLGKAIQIKGDTTYKADGTVEKAGNIKTSIDNGAIKVELSKDVDLSDKGSIKAGATTINKGGVDTNKVTIKDSTISISKDGINGGDKQITNVASGASEIIKDADGKVSYKYDNETNAANIGDVKRIAGDMKTEITNNVTDVTNKMGDELTQVQKDVKADRTYQGDDGAAKKVKVKFGSFLSLTGGAKLADLTEEGNIGVVQKEIDDPDNKGKKIAGLSVRLAKYLNMEKTTYTSNENGQTYTSEIDGKGLTIKTGDENRNITVQDGNVNMGGNKIESVAPGKVSKESTDAVNGSQLFATNQTVANLGGAVNKLGTRVNRVGAGAAALAALHPLDFDPDDKWDFAAGYGNYKDASAVAVGAYYRPNEDTMFSVGGSFGGGENMVNAGVSFKVGQGNHVSTSRVAMAKEIKDLRQDVANLNAIVNRQSALIDKLTGTNAGTIQDTGNDLFPDVPATTGLMNTSPS
ncbi:YadA-like family protein [Megasphaera sp.]|uniref:YadA-like family protein n=1 Tax=Megasphaera sp. TaxID=2023260 RepID=UPI003FF060F8